MTRFSQWWQREIRSGYALRKARISDGAPPEYHFAWESARAWFWGRVVAAWLPMYRVGVQALGLDRMAHLPFAYASKSHPRFRTVERSRVDCAISCGGAFCPKLGPNNVVRQIGCSEGKLV